MCTIVPLIDKDMFSKYINLSEFLQYAEFLKPEIIITLVANVDSR